MGGSPEKGPHFVKNFLSRARGVFHKERSPMSIVEDVWENVNDISNEIFYKYYSRDNPPIPNKSLGLLLNAALEEAVFYRYYHEEGKSNETLKEKTKPLPTVVFSEFENGFGNYKSEIYNFILRNLGTTETNVQAMASFIAFYKSEVLPEAELIVAWHKNKRAYRINNNPIYDKIKGAIAELEPGMQQIEASVRKR